MQRRVVGESSKRRQGDHVHETHPDVAERSMRHRHSDRPRAQSVQLSVLRAFDLRTDDEPITLPPATQRLVAFLALHSRALQRSFVAGTLWLDSSEARASASLRSALWRLRRLGVPIIEQESGRLSLAGSVRVDLWETTRIAERILHHGEMPEPFSGFREALSADLLPDWYEDWVFAERERFRQLRMHTLERLCQRLAQDGRWAEAVDAGLATVAGEPLRESGQRALIAAHLAEGNRNEALRQYETYRAMLRCELDVEPSPQMEELIAAARVGSVTSHESASPPP